MRAHMINDTTAQGQENEQRHNYIVSFEESANSTLLHLGSTFLSVITTLCMDYQTL